MCGTERYIFFLRKQTVLEEVPHNLGDEGCFASFCAVMAKRDAKQKQRQPS